MSHLIVFSRAPHRARLRSHQSLMSGPEEASAEAPRRVTSQDVAREAGVSRATVSYVLNGVQHQRISATTRARVAEAAHRLGYAPHAAAMTLRRGRTDIVLIDMPFWPLGPVVAEGIESAVSRLDELGYTPLVHFEKPSDSESLNVACRRVQPVGLFAPGERLSRAVIQELRANGTRGILALEQRPLDYVPTLVVRQVDIARAAVDHLTARGHARILALMPADPALERLREDRVAGAREAAESAGATLVTIESTLEEGALEAVFLPALRQAQPPTAVYAFNDDYALAALDVLGRKGVVVPGDVALIGCDDAAAARHSRPRLTTVRLPSARTFLKAANLLHALIEGRPCDPVLRGGPFEVVERQTT
jgi:DNA-binding LacI/PurR family transcriptional regulator